MARRPTLKDVAQMARVSEMTASRVLRGKGEASPYTCDRVRDAAKTLGYVPNQIAGSLSSNRVNLIGVIVPSVSSSVFSEVLTGNLYDEKDFITTKLQGITAVEKLVGKSEFNGVLGHLVVKPQGKPTLVDKADGRPAMGIEQAKEDFK